MEALGRLFDLGSAFAPVDMQTAANTGHRINMNDCGGVAFVLYKGAGTAGDDPVITLNEHNASTGGTSQVLATLTKHYQKQETTLDNDETWSEVTQSAGSTITLDATSAESQGIYVVQVNVEELSDGFDYLSFDVADVGGNAQLGAGLYIKYDLKVQRAPANLVAPLN